MPIGKNSIKRVSDGYSKVKSEAPDMENSTVIAAADPQVMEMVEKSAAKKPAAKKPAARKPVAKKPAARKPAAEAKDGAVYTTAEISYIKIGDEMPVYLL